MYRIAPLEATSGALTNAADSHMASLLAEPDYTRERATCVSNLLEAFCVGVISADSWWPTYSPPPFFPEAVAALSARLVARGNLAL